MVLCVKPNEIVLSLFITISEIFFCLSLLSDIYSIGGPSMYQNYLFMLQTANCLSTPTNAAISANLTINRSCSKSSDYLFAFWKNTIIYSLLINKHDSFEISTNAAVYTNNLLRRWFLRYTKIEAKKKSKSIIFDSVSNAIHYFNLPIFLCFYAELLFLVGQWQIKIS